MVPSPGNTRDESDTAPLEFELLAESQRSYPPRPGELPVSEVAFIGVERFSPEALRDARVQSFVKWKEEQERRFPPNFEAMFSHSEPPTRSNVLTRGEFEWGEYEILLSHLGKPRRTPRPVRDAAIQAFLEWMEEEEKLLGPRFRNYVDPTMVYAYELARGRFKAAETSDAPPRVPAAIGDARSDPRIGPAGQFRSPTE
jgi:hypothetical protein